MDQLGLFSQNATWIGSAVSSRDVSRDVSIDVTGCLPCSAVEQSMLGSALLEIGISTLHIHTHACTFLLCGYLTFPAQKVLIDERGVTSDGR